MNYSQAMFVIGSNTTEQHPVFGTMIRRAVKDRGVKLIVADPRRIDLCDFAVLHLQHRPGTDIALVNGLMYLILKNGWEDQTFIAERCENFEEFREAVMQYTPELASELTGVPVEKFHQAAEIMAKNSPMSVMWTLGVTQHVMGVRNVLALANLQMLLGNMGKPGGGTNPLRGQNNVQGACDMGGLPNVYTSYQAVGNDDVRIKFARAWGLDEKPRGKEETENTSVNGLSPSVGLTVTEMVPGILDGRTKAIYILGENPITSDPDSAHIRHSFERLDFLVLQDIFPTETSNYADVLLPGVSFAEKTGTVTNTERRVQMVRQAIASLGDSRQDWDITAAIAKTILDGQDDRPGTRQVDTNAPWAQWEYQDQSGIMTELNALSPSYAGITHARLERGERLQWPVSSSEHPGTPILHTKGFARGKGRFAAIEHIPAPELPDDEYPMVLSTGRVLYHWHGGALTRRAKGLMEVYPEAMLELCQEDADKLGLNGYKRVLVTSRRGKIETDVWITDRVPPGMAFANFHFPESSANELTIAALDPVSKIPSYKVCAIRVEAISETKEA